MLNDSAGDMIWPVMPSTRHQGKRGGASISQSPAVQRMESQLSPIFQEDAEDASAHHLLVTQPWESSPSLRFVTWKYAELL